MAIDDITFLMSPVRTENEIVAARFGEDNFAYALASTDSQTSREDISLVSGEQAAPWTEGQMQLLWLSPFRWQ
jgi:hypothetical protein